MYGGFNMKMTVGNKLHITGSITDETNTPVTGSTCTLNINNATEEVTLNNGTLNVDKIFDAVGDYDVRIGYGDVESTITNVTVLKAKPSLGVTGYTDTMSSSDQLNIVATLLDNKGNPITGSSVRFKDLTTDYGVNVTGDDGKCSLTASNLDLGYHRFSIIYDGNEVFDATHTGFDVKVIKTKKDSSLSINLSSSSINLGESVTVTSTLTGEDGSAISGATVSLMVGSIDSSITNYATISTDITNSQGVITFNYTPTDTGNMSLYLSSNGTDTYAPSTSETITLTVVDEDKAVEILSNINNWVKSTNGVNNAEVYTSTDGYAGIKLTAVGRTVLNQYFTDKTAYTLEFDMLLNKDNRQGICFNQEPSSETNGVWFGTDVGKTTWNDETTLFKNYFSTGTHHFKLVRNGSTATWIIDDEEVYTYTGIERNCIGFVIWGMGWLAVYNFKFTL